MTDIVEKVRKYATGSWEEEAVLLHEAADEIERLRAAFSDGALRDVLWGILTPDDGTAPPPNYTLVQLARDRMSDIERLRERLHYCNGVADDRWQEIERLRASLQAFVTFHAGHVLPPELVNAMLLAREALGDGIERSGR